MTSNALPLATQVPQTSDIRKYAFIDALRGLACLGVIAIHILDYVGPTWEPVRLVAAFGDKGVQLFYLLSAFTLFLSYQQRSRTDDRPILFFWIRRFFRIAPLFYAVLIVNLFWRGMGPRTWAPDGIGWDDIGLAITFLNAWKPNAITSVVDGGWSIAIEMSFYCFIPFLFHKITNLSKALNFTCLAYMGGLVLSEAGLAIARSQTDEKYHRLLDHYFNVFWLPRELFVFGLGICLFFLFQKLLSLSISPGQKRQFSRSLLLVAAMLMLAAMRRFGDVLLLFSLAWLALTLSLALQPRIWLVNPLLIRLGKVSYSIYLLHFLVLRLLGPQLAATPWIQQNSDPFFSTLKILFAFSLTTAVTYLLAEITFRSIEQPGLRFGKRLIAHLTRSSQPAA